MKKKATLFAITISVAICFASCAVHNHPVSYDKGTGYELGDLYNYFGRIPYQEEMIYSTSPSKKNYKDANEQFPNGTDYSDNNERVRCTVYPVRGDGLFFVFWSNTLTPGFERNPIDKECAFYSFYYSAPHKLQEFDSISRGSTAADVALIDPGMEMSFTASTGPYSYHILEDDQILRIKYLYPVSSEMLSRNNLIVLSMDVLSPDTTSNPFCKCQFAVEVIKQNQ